MLVRFLAPVTALACTSLCIALWLAGFSRLVLRVMHLVASSYSQFDQPYADTYNVLAIMQCYRQGIDIYVSNPCDLYNRLNVYSAVWLLGAHLPVTTASTLLVGSALAVAFCLSLFLLPPARTRLGAFVLTAGVLSNAAIFACYQGNADLVVFVLVALAGRGLMGGLGARVAGYALLLGAGSLKFYPVALMVLALRERIQVLLAVAACACVAVAAFVWVDGADAVRAMHLIPGGKVTQMFGASVIGRGLAVFPGGLRASVAAPHWVWYGAIVEIACCAAVAAGAWRLFQHRGLRGAITALPAPEKIFAAIGCVLILACFFSGQSYRYRGIFLLFVLPAAVTLCAAAGDQFVRRGAAALALAIVALMWSVHIGNGLDHAMTVVGVPDRIGGLVYAAWWLAREMLWWAIIAVLLGLLGGLAAEWHGISAVLAVRPRRAPGGRAPPAATHGPQRPW
jgi:hypothetical protein